MQEEFVLLKDLGLTKDTALIPQESVRSGYARFLPADSQNAKF